MPKHSKLETLELRRCGTDEEAAASITNALGHVAFLAWLIECRDQRDARICQLIARRRQFLDSPPHLCADVAGLLKPQGRA